MRISLIGYFLKKALEHFRINPFLSLVTLSSIAISMLILGLFVLIYLSIQQYLQQWGDELRITAYLYDTLSQQQIQELRSEITAWPEVDETVFISKTHALARFRTGLGEYAGILEGLKENPLPASLVLKLNSEGQPNAAVEELAARLESVPGVSEVQYGKRWMAKLRVFLDVVKLAGITVGGLLLLATMFVVSNTVKLTFYSRQDELEIMRLVGATDFFIKAPFLIEGLLHGLFGALLAAGILLLLLMLLFSHLDLPVKIAMMPGSLLSVQVVLGFLSLGILLGILGSAVSLRRFLRS